MFQLSICSSSKSLQGETMILEWRRAAFASDMPRRSPSFGAVFQTPAESRCYHSFWPCLSLGLWTFQTFTISTNNHEYGWSILQEALILIHSQIRNKVLKVLGLKWYNVWDEIMSSITTKMWGRFGILCWELSCSLSSVHITQVGWNAKMS